MRFCSRFVCPYENVAGERSVGDRSAIGVDSRSFAGDSGVDSVWVGKFRVLIVGRVGVV